MFAFSRTAAWKGCLFVALTLAGVFSSTAWGNAAFIPPEERESAKAPAETEELPLRMIYDSSAKHVTLTVPKKFAAAFQKADKSIVLPIDAVGGRNDGWRFLATVIGGTALSLGALLLGLWIVRRPTAGKRKLIGGTIAGVAFFVGLSAAFADLAVPDRQTPTTIKIVFVEEGDRLELTQP